MQLEPDVEAIFNFVEGKKIKIYEGYRPAHKIAEDILTTGVHHYYDIYGELKKGTITFISPEKYPNTLWVGKKVEMYDGSVIIGYAIIIKIFNTILDKEG